MWWPAFRSGDVAGGGAEGSSVWGDRLSRPPRGKALSLQTPPSWQAVPSPAPPALAGPPELCHLPSGCQPPAAHHLTIDPNWMLATRWQRVAWAQNDS